MGHLERLGHGIYRAAGVPADRFEALKDAWLSVDPKLTAEERLRRPVVDAVVSGAAAAYLHGLGDLVPEPYEFTVPSRRQTQRSELRFRVRQLPKASVTLREGLPVTTVEQTIADLVEARTDQSMIAGLLADASSLDRTRLAELLGPLAARNGFPSGEAFCDQLDRTSRPREFTVPTHWGPAYAKLAKNTPAGPYPIAAARELLHDFIDPVLSGQAGGGWHPETRVWS